MLGVILLACSSAPAIDPLPAGLAVTVVFQDDVTGTVLVDLRAPGEQPTVRYRTGAWTLEPTVAALSPGAPQTGPWQQLGPGLGFVVTQDADALWLQLPHAQDRILLADQVRAVHAVSFLDEVPEHPEGFRAARMLWAQDGAATVDGELDEWKGQTALVVDSARFLDTPTPSWTGARDAGFGVAARRDGDQIRLAVRVRDDDVVQGQDTLLLELPGHGPVQVPVRDKGPCDTTLPEGWTCAWADTRREGTAVELGWSRPPGAEGRDRPTLRLVVRYRDVDDDGSTAELSTAPDLASLRAVPRRLAQQ